MKEKSLRRKLLLSLFVDKELSTFKVLVNVTFHILGGLRAYIFSHFIHFHFSFYFIRIIGVSDALTKTGIIRQHNTNCVNCGLIKGI